LYRKHQSCNDSEVKTFITFFTLAVLTMTDPMGDLAELERLSLVSKVTSEIQNHTGMVDKTLAEFAIAQHASSKGLDEFKAMLGEFFPTSLIESIDRLVLTMDPKRKVTSKSKNNGANADGQDEGRSRVFKGLAIPDKEQPFADELDDTMAMLEGLAGGRGGASGKEVNGSRQDHGARDGHSSRKRSRSPEREKRRSRPKQDNYYEPPIPTRIGNGDHNRDRRQDDRRDGGRGRDDRYNDGGNGSG